jgi:acetyltransferase-like isoleucine patch superfamily enzyme
VQRNDLIQAPLSFFDNLQNKKLRVLIRNHGNKPIIKDTTLLIGATSGELKINLGHDHSFVVFGRETSGVYDLRLWRTSRVTIGKHTTATGIRILCDNSTVSIGVDCMLSDTILIQSADQHGIIYLATRTIINNIHRSVRIEDHVWLGRHCTVMPDVIIGEGLLSVLGLLLQKRRKLCTSSWSTCKGNQN